MNPDGVSYLDVASTYLRGDWRMAINGYWSPLYSWLLGAAMFVARPSPYRESTVVHLVNFAVFVFGLGCFEFFLAALLRWLHANESLDSAIAPLPDWVWWALGYALFLWSSLHWIGVSIVTPDLCVAAIVYLAIGVLLRICAGGAGWATLAALGAILGVGYLAKAPMFPLAVAFLAASGLVVGSFRRALPRLGIALVTFLLIAGPYLVVLSRAKGRLTFGDTGEIAYARFVTGVENWVYWQGEGRGEGVPRHPTRKVLVAPPLYEFATPVGGTFPPWYDPSYWYEGVVARFNLRGQLRAAREGLHVLVNMLSGQKELIFCFLALFLLERRMLCFARRVVRQLTLWLPALAALAMYALVHTESRYIGAFLVVLWAGLLAGLRLPRSQPSPRFVQCVVVAALVITAGKLVKISGSDLLRALDPPTHRQWEVAEDLHRMGVRPGEKVASVGSGMEVYWARLARVSIVAEIPAEAADSFWGASPAVQREAIDTFARVGAERIVADVPPGSQLLPGWQRIGRTDYFVYSLSK